MEKRNKIIRQWKREDSIVIVMLVVIIVLIIAFLAFKTATVLHKLAICDHANVSWLVCLDSDTRFVVDTKTGRTEVRP